ARQQNYAYAFELLRETLMQEPAFWEARQAIRKTQFEKTGIGEKTNIVRQIFAGIMTVIPVFIIGPIYLKKNQPKKAMDLAEKCLIYDPTFLPSLNLLCQGFEALELRRHLVDTLEMAEKYHPKSTGVLNWLVEAYSRVGDGHNALRIQQKIVELSPENQDALGSLKSAAALAAMEEGHWEDADSFHDLIRDKDKSETLEKKGQSVARDEATLQHLIKSAEADVNETDNATNRRNLAKLYRQHEQYDKALECYNRVIEITGTMEANIDVAISETMSESYDKAIKEWQEYAKEDEANREEADKNIKEIAIQKQDMRFERAKERIKYFPGNPEFRYELGEMYFNHKYYSEALKQFQRAQKNPNFRDKSVSFMAKCFMAKKQYDIAVEQLRGILEKLPTMNNFKKDTLYSLGIALEKIGEFDEAADYFKQIYQVDVEFKDIQDKIDAFYARKKKKNKE
ncbi:MAG: tetratricopeptide repeat protein, partial [Verrucomicrobiota bacterium]|nr:tetratricopeptide repeat protein [Verrucomicrobiota bacterium]